jgi:hypothetical protein
MLHDMPQDHKIKQSIEVEVAHVSGPHVEMQNFTSISGARLTHFRSRSSPTSPLQLEQQGDTTTADIKHPSARHTRHFFDSLSPTLVESVEQTLQETGIALSLPIVSRWIISLDVLGGGLRHGAIETAGFAMLDHKPVAGDIVASGKEDSLTLLGVCARG